MNKAIFLLMALSVIGAGCSKDTSSSTYTVGEGQAGTKVTVQTTQKDDYFYKKQECAKYQKQLEQENQKANATPFSVEILGSVCYSKELNTCIAFVENVYFDDKYNEKNAILRVNDILTGTSIDSVSYILNPTESKQDAVDKKMNYLTEAENLHKRHPCVN